MKRNYAWSIGLVGIAVATWGTHRSALAQTSNGVTTGWLCLTTADMCGMPNNQGGCVTGLCDSVVTVLPEECTLCCTGAPTVSSQCWRTGNPADNGCAGQGDGVSPPTDCDCKMFANSASCGNGTCMGGQNANNPKIRNCTGSL